MSAREKQCEPWTLFVCKPFEPGSLVDNLEGVKPSVCIGSDNLLIHS